MKKKIVTISVALIVSILVGCSAKQTEPTPESEPKTETISTEPESEPTVSVVPEPESESETIPTEPED